MDAVQIIIAFQRGIVYNGVHKSMNFEEAFFK